MTREEALKIIKETEADYTQRQRILRGLLVLAQYDDNMIFSFEHDQMWVSSFDQTVARMTRDDCRLSLIPGAFVS
jgi:hypothetical protein